ncbi:MAG: DNA double-strand break repair nuclease NurA [Anaerolineales bacterium]|nr:DNA double-strand break repair nuclease NurA [Anaerolineales bacterium]
MPIDFQQVYSKIKEIGAGARQRQKTLEERRDKARDLLNTYAGELDALKDKVIRALEQDPNLRCALPLNEHLNTHIPVPENIPDVTLIAADGSQINPDRHETTQFCLVNVGAIVMQLNSGQTPEIFTDSDLRFGEELETQSGGMLSEGMVALQRDLKERGKLEELARQFEGPVITFTDGPVELWGSREGEEAAAYRQALVQYKSVLSRLQEQGVVTAGYVDKPAANLVVRLLEIARALPEDLENLRAYRPLRGVSDRWLYGDEKKPLLAPGERSAVFAIQAKSQNDYQGLLALHFFYLNVGTAGHPWPVRVEIPKWVVDQPEKLKQLHAVLVQQCRLMGSRPYPYLLHRSHEIAVVSLDEKAQLQQMLEMELRSNAGEVGELSYKQSAKNLKGRTRR